MYKRQSQWVAKEITERSNGHIVVELHGAGTLGGDTELVSQVMEGTIPLVGLSISALSQYTNLYECTQLPFLLSDYEKEKAALDSDEFAALTAEVEKTLNLKFLGSAENGMRHFATKDRQINGIDDLKGLKLRIMTSNVIQETITRLGANVTTMAYNEVYTGLQNGVIDGEEINITSAGMQKHYDLYIHQVDSWQYSVPGHNVFQRKALHTTSSHKVFPVQPVPNPIHVVYKQSDVYKSSPRENLNRNW